MNLVNLVSVVSIILLGLLLLIFTVLLPVTIIFNTRSGMKYRQALVKQLEHLRLGKMLRALGIDTDSYLAGERVVDIRKQMERCSACANTEECDNQLAGGVVDAGTIDFCNNEASLQKIAGRLRE
jgi:hypothetical protein